MDRQTHVINKSADFQQRFKKSGQLETQCITSSQSDGRENPHLIESRETKERISNNISQKSSTRKTGNGDVCLYEYPSGKKEYCNLFNEVKEKTTTNETKTKSSKGNESSITINKSIPVKITSSKLGILQTSKNLFEKNKECRKRGKII